MKPLLMLPLPPWLIFGGFFVTGLLAAWLGPKLLAAALTWWMKFTRGRRQYTTFIQRALRPLTYLLMIVMWYYGLLCVGLPEQIHGYARYGMVPLGVLFVMISFLRSVDIFALWFRRKLRDAKNRQGLALVGLCAGVLKFVVVCVGGIGIAQVFGFSALGLVSGLGIGGIAVALAAQPTISNFFGSLTLLLDQPFTVGDYVVVQGIEGVVESIGIRTTKVRTFYDSCVYIPNNTLAGEKIDNMGQRAARRMKTLLGLRYDTPPERLEQFCAAVREMLDDTPNVEASRSNVSVYDFADSAIQVMFICFFRVETAAEEYVMRQNVVTRVLQLAQETGVAFAFPTRTVVREE